MKTQLLNKAKKIRISALLFASLFLSLNLNAQLSAKSYEWKKVGAEILTSKEQIKNALLGVKTKNAFSEEEILLEDWMTDLNSWLRIVDSSEMENADAEPVSYALPLEAEILDENLELENWMLDANWIFNESFVDEELSFENWMDSPKNWNLYSCE